MGPTRNNRRDRGRGRGGGSGNDDSVPNNSAANVPVDMVNASKKSKAFNDTLADVQAQFNAIYAKLGDLNKKYDDLNKKYDDLAKQQGDMKTELDKLKKCAKCSKIRNENWQCEGCVYDRAMKTKAKIIKTINSLSDGFLKPLTPPASSNGSKDYDD
ncbi:uncharacterized protein LOC129578552 [Sitodiplosis mosellana]|uniref:uncharacterized protein LOC129578552 n=1 Tax=Sitodiplosis mosellana TaxID=263140 RepID=UPI002443A34B|nr:uncharacterized protein LOC129578552 [Sitodiplosis mosellana]